MHPDHYRNDVISRLTQLFSPVSSSEMAQLHDGPTRGVLTDRNGNTNGKSFIVVPRDSEAYSLEERCKNALYARLERVLRTAKEQRWAIEEVACSARFAGLSWAVKDEVIREVTSTRAAKESRSSIEVPKIKIKTEQMNRQSDHKVTRGQWIKYETFGFGEVLAVTRTKVQVKFLIGGERIVEPKTVKLARQKSCPVCDRANA